MTERQTERLIEAVERVATALEHAAEPPNVEDIGAAYSNAIAAIKEANPQLGQMMDLLQVQLDKGELTVPDGLNPKQ